MMFPLPLPLSFFRFVIRLLLFLIYPNAVREFGSAIQSTADPGGDRQLKDFFHCYRPLYGDINLTSIDWNIISFLAEYMQKRPVVKEEHIKYRGANKENSPLKNVCISAIVK